MSVETKIKIVQDAKRPAVMGKPLQRHPVFWSCKDSLCAVSREHAIYLLQTKWHAWVDEKGNFGIPVRQSWINQHKCICKRVPDYVVGKTEVVTFYRLAMPGGENGQNWSQAQVYIRYVLPGTKFIEADRIQRQGPTASEILHAARFPKRPVQCPGGEMFSSKL